MIAMVTGASSGFGEAISRLLVQAGYRVIGTGRRAERLAALADELVAATTEDPRDPWDSASVPAEHAVRGQHSSVLTVADADSTLRVANDQVDNALLGFRQFGILLVEQAQESGR